MKIIEAKFYPVDRYSNQCLSIVVANVTRFHPMNEYSTYVLSGSEGITIDMPYDEFKRLMVYDQERHE